MLSDLGFCFCLKQIGKANHSQVDYFANKPAILGFAGSRVGSTNCASHPPARKGNSNVTNARAQAAFLDTRAAHTRIRISTPNLGVLIYVIGTTSRPTRRVGRLKPRGSGKLGRPPVPNATAKRCPS